MAITHAEIGRKYANKEEADAAVRRANQELIELCTRYGMHSLFSVFTLILEDGELALGGSLEGCSHHLARSTAKAIVSQLDDETLNQFTTALQESMLQRIALFIHQKAQELAASPAPLTEEQQQLLNMQVPGGPKWQN